MVSEFFSAMRIDGQINLNIFSTIDIPEILYLNFAGPEISICKALNGEVIKDFLEFYDRAGDDTDRFSQTGKQLTNQLKKKSGPCGPDFLLITKQK